MVSGIDRFHCTPLCSIYAFLSCLTGSYLFSGNDSVVDDTSNLNDALFGTHTNLTFVCMPVSQMLQYNSVCVCVCVCVCVRLVASNFLTGSGSSPASGNSGTGSGIPVVEDTSTSNETLNTTGTICTHGFI